ncbi:MAG: radical SAM protein [Patescibacteria group bacterium]
MRKRFHLEVTGKCNLRCRYCYNSAFSTPEQLDNELTLEEQLMLISQASTMGCNKFIWSGGEPFIYDHIFDLIEACPKTSHVSVITNASHLGDSIIERLDSIEQFKELKISWDGFSAHDSVRLGSSHQQVYDAIRSARSHAPRLNIIINTMMSKYSAGEIGRLYGTLKDLGVHHWRIDMPFNSGRCTENADIMDISFEQIVLTYRDLLTQYFADGKPMILEVFNVYKSMMGTDAYYDFDSNVHPCAYYDNTIVMRPNGDLTYCPSLGFPLANWRDGKDLAETERLANLHPYHDLLLSDIGACLNCRYMKLCGGGCRADAITWGSRLTGCDPFNCSMMPYIERHIIPILPPVEQAMYRYYIDPSKNNPRSYVKASDIDV